LALLTAESCLATARDPFVHEYLAGLEFGRHPVSAAQITRPYTGRQPEWRVVRDRYRLGLIPEADDAQHRTEDLLPGNAHRVVDLGEDCWLDELACDQPFLGWPLTADGNAGPFGPADLDVLLDLRVLHGRGDGAHVRVLDARPYRHSSIEADKPLNHLVVDVSG